MKRPNGNEPNPPLKIENEVLIGLNEELFLAGGAHGVLDVALGRKALSESSQATFLKNLKSRRAYCAERGAQFLQLVAPEKYVVHPDLFPVQKPKSLYDFVRPHVPKWCWYPSRELNENTYGRSYYPTDTHWTPFGIARIVEAIAKQARIDDSIIKNVMRSICERITVATLYGVGDLGSKLEPKRTSKWYRFTPSPSTRIMENGLSHKGGANAANINDGRLFCSENPHAASDKQILIFGDSYLYDGVPILAEFFRRVVLCRSRHFHQELVDMMKPDFVVGEMAERYLTRVSDDAKAMPFFLMPYAMGRQPDFTADAARFIGRFFSYGREPDYSIYSPPPGAVPTPSPPATVKKEVTSISVEFSKGASLTVEQGSRGGLPHQGIVANGVLTLSVNESARVARAMKAIPGNLYRVEYDAGVARAPTTQEPLTFFVGPLFVDAAGKVVFWWQKQCFAIGEQRKSGVVQTTAPPDAAFVFLGWSGPRSTNDGKLSDEAVAIVSSRLVKPDG